MHGVRAHGRRLRLLLVVSIVVATAYQSGVVIGQIAAGATLTVLRGTVSVVHSDGSAISPAGSGLTLGVGDRIATIGRSSALVTFFEGSEVELGADTTIVIQELGSGGGDLVTIIIENVLGSTINHVATFTNPGSSYRVVANDTETLVQGTVFGLRNSDSGAVTAYLAEASGPVYFPNEGTRLYVGQACTATERGDLQCVNVGTGAKAGDIWSILTDGDRVGAVAGTENPGSSTGSPVHEPPPDGDKDNSLPTPTVTATATATGAAAATATATPTATETPGGPTLTPTPTATPNGSTPTPTSTATPTPTTQTLPAGPATITVNTKIDGNVRDAVLTFREAILLTTGGLTYAQLTVAEQAQVTGGTGGPGFACTIVFDPVIFSRILGPALADSEDVADDLMLRAPAALTTLALTSALPAFTAGNTTINANGNILLLGNGTFDGLTMQSSGNTVRGLQLHGFANGIVISSGTGNTIGGTTAATRNVIGGSTAAGVLVQANSNTIQGNYIGLDAAGAPDANGVGIKVTGTAFGNTIGGTTSGAGNVISSNTGNGVDLASTIGRNAPNRLLANIIGLDPTATTARPNGQYGVDVASGSNGNVIGAAGAGNIIARNSGPGIVIASDNNTIQGNFIGTDLSGTKQLPNGNYGILVALSGSNNLIGGTGSGEGNTIAFHIAAGISISGGAQNTIRSNRIYQNGDAAILVDSTAQNGVVAPFISSASTITGHVQGAVSCSSLPCTLEVFDNNPAENEARTPLGTVLLTQTGGFDVPISGLVANHATTATVTLSTGDTSAVSNASPTVGP